MTAEYNEVAYVGYGPGPLDLMTVRAIDSIKAADVIFYDSDTPVAMLEMAKEGCLKELYYEHQKEECSEVLQAVFSGKHVVRLLKGDPFMFEHVDHEVAVLRANGIPFKIVPGLTSALAIPSALGIPLTSFDFAASLLITAGALRPATENIDAYWEHVAGFTGLIVIMLPRNQISSIAGKLIGYGMAQDTPAVIIEKGFTQEQRTIKTRLDSLTSMEDVIKIPALLLIGDILNISPFFLEKTDEQN